MTNALSLLSGFVAGLATSMIVGRLPRPRRITNLRDLSARLQHDIGITDVDPVIRGAPRRPNRWAGR